MGWFDNSKKFIEAAKAGDEKTVNAYLKNYYWRENKVDLNARDEGGMTAFAHAVTKGNVKMVTRMLRYSLDPNIPDNGGNTPLVIAIATKQRAVALLLADHYTVKVDAHGANFVTPLHLAAHQGDIEIVQKLAARGADLNAVITENGYTPLHWAIANNHSTVAEFLVQSGARIDIPDKSGKTALERAREKGDYMAKIVETPVAPKPQEAPPEDTEEPEAAEETYPDNDRWIKSGAQRVTHIVEHPEINRRLTEIFNFEARERTILMENLDTGAETLSPPESFDAITESALRKAFAEFTKQGGKADESQILGKRNAPRGFNP